MLMTMEPEPQAGGAAAQVATPASSPPGGGFDRAAFVERVMAKFPEEGEGEGGGEPQTPAAGTGPATGEITPPAGAGAAPTSDPDGPAPLDTPEAHAAWLAARDARHEESRRAALEQQRRSLVGEIEAERRARDNSALLAELDELDPEELGERVKTDRKALEALATRVNSQDAGVVAAAKLEVVTGQVPHMLAAGERIEKAGGPSLRAMLETADGEDYNTMVQTEGGIFRWLVDHAWAASGPEHIAKFKESAEYKDAIAQAKESAVKDAFGRVGGPPARDESRPPVSAGQRQESDNARVRAVQRAMAATGVTDFDFEEFGAEAPRIPQRRAS